MGKADLHIHTRVSDGLATVPDLIEHVEHHLDLDVIAVTDHEDATGGLRARELAAKRGYRIEVVVGAEVTTIHGHLLALFIESAPKSFRSVESTLEAIHAQDGLAIVPHPTSWLTRSLSRRTISRICERGEAGVTFDAIELASPNPAARVVAARAAALNDQWGLVVTGGSDAHHLLHVGTGWTGFDGTTAEDLRHAILSGQTDAAMSPYPSLREIGVGKAILQLAWGYTATPRKMARVGPFAQGRGGRDGTAGPRSGTTAPGARR